MKPHGYYFCDTCEESTHSAVCPQCRRPARRHDPAKRRIRPDDLQRFAGLYAAVAQPKPA
jgi:predicted amidophosphoribosyltransferase